VDRAVTLETLGAWVIKCNPRRTDVEPMRAAGAATPSWCVADNYRTRLISPTQRVLFWVSAHRRRGFWGAGDVTGDVTRDDAGQLHVPVRIPLFDEPLTAAELTAAGLHSMEVFRSPQQANPSWLSRAELALIEPLLASRVLRATGET